MLFAEIEERRNYGARQSSHGQTPFFRVRVLEKVRRPGGNHVKVRHLDEPHPDSRSTSNPLRSLRRGRTFQRSCGTSSACSDCQSRSASSPDRTVQRAVETIFEAAGDQSVWCRPSGIVECNPDSLQHIADRARVDEGVTRLAPHAFVDRRGKLHLPFAAVEQLARLFAAAEPETVGLYIDGCEESSFARAGAVHADFDRDWYLTEEKPGWELARQWTGSKQQVSALERENRRLRGLVELARASAP